MATKKQIEANRRNARRSTGPRTAEGKAAVSRNALSHGLSARAVVLPTENETDFQELCGGLEAEWHPQTTTERFLLEQMAVVQWKLARIETLETALLAGRSKPAAKDRSLEQFSRHQNRLRRAWQQSLKALLALRKAREIPAQKLTNQSQFPRFREQNGRDEQFLNPREPPIQTWKFLRPRPPASDPVDDAPETIVINDGKPDPDL